MHESVSITSFIHIMKSTCMFLHFCVAVALLIDAQTIYLLYSVKYYNTVPIAEIVHTLMFSSSLRIS